MKEIAGKQKTFSVIHRFKSFSYAWSGMRSVLNTEHNTWIHLAMTVMAVTAGVLFRISGMEAAALVIVMAMVWVAEIFNTCLEKIMDFITTQYHPQVKVIKDMAAAAVLITSVAAFIVGAIIFLPKLF